MHTVKLTREVFEEFRDLQIRPRADWPATFSCNPRREVWPFQGYGYTEPKDRVHLESKFDLLDHIVEAVLEERPEGGRFFIDDDGVYVPTIGSNKHAVAIFHIVDSRGLQAS